MSRTTNKKRNHGVGRLLAVLVFVLLFLTGCSLKIKDLVLDSADSLKAVTGEVYDARRAYLEGARQLLSDRGVTLVLDNSALSVSSNTQVDMTAVEGYSTTELDTLSKSVLLTNGSGRDKVKGHLLGENSDTNSDMEIDYEFFYGSAAEKSLADDTSTGQNPSGWFLWLDLSGYDVDADAVADALNAQTNSYYSVDKPGGTLITITPASGNGWVGEGESINVIFDNKDYKWSKSPSDMPSADPTNSSYGAYGQGTSDFVKACTTTGAAQTNSLFKALSALTSSSLVLAPANNNTKYADGYAPWKQWENNYYIRTGPIDSDTWNLQAWDGVGKGGKNSNVTEGYEILASTVIDYGSIWTLKPDVSARDLHECQKKLYNYFGSGASSVVTASGSTGDLDGSAGLDCFVKTEFNVMPPGFGILCYSMIPRSGVFSNNIGEAYAVGTEANVALGFVGPNPKTIQAMNTVLGSSGSGFAVINQNIYLMTYPVAALNYLYTDEDGSRAYLGFGAAPVYYNLVYDRLDYKYGTEYQFQASADQGVSDTELYTDYTFVGGISVTDSTGGESSDGGVYILSNDGSNSTCRVQIAAKENVAKAEEQFQALVNDYYIRNIPVDPAVCNRQFPGSDKTVGEWLLGKAADHSDAALEERCGSLYFKQDVGKEYIEAWADGMEVNSIEIPQFIMLDYVEATLLPEASSSDVVVTGRKIRLLPSAIKYDTDKHLYYYSGNSATPIAQYVSMDGSVKGDKVFLGDVVDIRALAGAGYTKCVGDDIDSIQPPYGYNALFPIGVKLDDYEKAYDNDIQNFPFMNKTVSTELQAWVDTYAQKSSSSGLRISDFGSMSYWDGTSGVFQRQKTSYAGDGTAVYQGSEFYQTVSVVNNVATLTHNVSNNTATAIVACLAVSGADKNAHLGVTDVQSDTTIDELPYVPTRIITFSEPFPNTLFGRADTHSVYLRDSETTGAVPPVFYAVAIGTGITRGNFYHSWVKSVAPTDSLAWWNNYLEAHGYAYRVKPQVVEKYLNSNYSYLANSDNNLRFEQESAEYWAEELDDMNPKRGGYRTLNLVLTLSNVLGWILILYAIVCLLLWAVDIYAGFDKDFYRTITGGRYVASAEKMPAKGKTHYATFGNALARSALICLAGIGLIYVGAAVLLATMFRMLALILRVLTGYVG